MSRDVTLALPPLHTHPEPALPPIVRFALRFGQYYVRGCHRLSVVSPCRIPPTGPAIVACNHISGLDPVLIQAACPRLITWMIAREYHATPGLQWFFRAIRAIPVQRTGRDLAATRAALRALDAGEVIGVFPQGRLSSTTQFLPFQTGVGLLAISSGARVYPAAINGTMRGLMFEAYVTPHRAALAFGEPIPVDQSDRSREAVEKVALTIQKAVVALRNRYLLPHLPC